MKLVQIGVLIFSLFALSRVFLRARDKKLTMFEFLFWIGIWVSLVVTTFFPDLMTFIAGIIGLGRGVDIIVYMSIAALFYLIFRLYIKLEDLDQKLTVVVREMAYLKRKK